MEFLSALKAQTINGLTVIHTQFRGHPFFGPLVFILLTVPLMLPPQGGASTDAIKYACLLLGIGVLFLSFPKTVSGFAYAQFFWWVIAWVLWVSLATVLSRDSLQALLGGYPRYNSSWVVYMAFAGVASVVIFLGKSYIRSLVNLLVVATTAIALFGLLQSFGFAFYYGIENLLSSILPRVPSLMGNPNFSAWWIAAVLPFAVMRLLSTPSRISRMGWIVLLFVWSWSLAVFSSRGALLAVGAALCILLVCILVQKQWRSVLVVCLAVIIALAMFSGYYRMYRSPVEGSIIKAQDTSAVERYIPWYMAGKLWSEHKVFGIGPGNYDQYYWEELPNSTMGGDQYFDDPHNILLSVLVDVGAGGFILFASLFGLAGSLVVMLLKTSGMTSESIAAAAGSGAWLMAALFNPTVIALWLLLAVFLGILFLHAPIKEKTIALSPVSRWSFRGMGLIFCYLAVAFTVGEYALVYSIALEAYRTRVPDALQRQRSYTKWAALIEPFHMESRYAALATELFTGARPETLRLRIISVYNLHPESCRSALIASQMFYELWQRSKSQEDIDKAEEYLQIALGKSAGFPVAKSWAAYFYWQTGDNVRSKQYVHYAVQGHPQAFNNWLLLAKLYREEGNVRGVTYALSKAQDLAPYNIDLAKRRKELAETGNIRSFDVFPGEPSVLTRLH